MRVASTFSIPKQLTGGVVHGSVLGLLLFLPYVDDVVTLFNHSIVCKLYADDLKLHSVIQTIDDVSALLHLQHGLINVN